MHSYIAVYYSILRHGIQLSCNCNVKVTWLYHRGGKCFHGLLYDNYDDGDSISPQVMLLDSSLQLPPPVLVIPSPSHALLLGT